MILTIFLGLFSSICEDLMLQTILLVVLMFLNLYFVLKFCHDLIGMKLNFINQQNSSFKYIPKFMSKFFKKGIFDFDFMKSFTF